MNGPIRTVPLLASGGQLSELGPPLRTLGDLQLGTASIVWGIVGFFAPDSLGESQDEEC